MANYSLPKIRQLLRESDNAATTALKGAKLEELLCYVFAKLRGVSFLARNILDANRAHELDVAFWNEQNQSDVCFLDAIIIVECKSTANPVGSSGVAWFVHKLRDRGASYGILVALSGVTGAGSGQTSAHSEILNALTRDRIRILLLSRQELMGLRTTEDLVQLLRDKMLNLILQRTVV